MNITLCGYGVVGKGIEQLCKKQKNLNIQHIYVRKEKENLPFFSNDDAIITDPKIDIVMECLNGLEPANTLIRKALQAKKHVITSNKAVIATYYDEYLKLAKEHNTTIQVEACVAGGIPFIDALLKLQRLEPLQGFEGIFNGTSNFILDKMSKNNFSFSEALQKAQIHGYAEKDPTNDIEGIDVWYKTKIANAIAYQSKIYDLPQPLGISKIQIEDIQMAKAKHKTIRHLALSKRVGKSFCSIIAPAFLDSSSYLANIPDNYNAQILHAESFTNLGYFGQGAGQLATAQAMMQNALDVIDNTVRCIQTKENLTFKNDLIKENWIIRSNKDLKLPFSKKEGIYYWVKSQDLTLLESIKEQDQNAMIALWR